jgi:hypothetical protein
MCKSKRPVGIIRNDLVPCQESLDPRRDTGVVEAPLECSKEIAKSLVVTCGI